MGSLLADGKGLGLRFTLVGLLPSALFVLFLAGLWASGAPTGQPDVGTASSRVGDLNLSESGLAAFLILVASLVIQPLQRPLVQLLEGYWGPWTSRLAMWSGIGAWMRSAQHGRREELVEAVRSAPMGRPDPVAFGQLQRRFPRTGRILPSSLGNILRAMEDSAGQRYGLDTVSAWPRLFGSLPDALRSALDDQRNQLDLAARFCAVFFLMGLASVPALIWHPSWFLPVSIVVSAALSRIAYRSAVAAALAYSQTIEAAFDLHRFELLRALHLPLPSCLADERRENTILSAFLVTGVHPDTDSGGFQYDHGS